MVLLFMSALMAQQDRISVESKLDKQSITVGDRVTYTVIITADTTLTVDSLAIGSNLGAFEIKDFTPRESQLAEGLRIYKQSYEITTFTTGEYQIPPLEINYQTVSGEEKTIKTDPVPLTVKSLLSGEDGADIRPIRGPVEFESPFPLWWVIGGAVVALAAVLGYILYRRARKPIDLGEEPVDTRLPWEITLEELDKLESAELIAKGEFKAFYFRLSEIFRAYLERRYGIAALERTTYEILQEFRALSLESEEEKEIRQLLEECDLVKFAKFPPTTEGARAAYDATRAFVMKTRTLPFSSKPGAGEARKHAAVENPEATG